MKKTANSIITISLLFLFQNYSAQENFIEGYIINKQDDTIHGFIDYKNWSNNPQEIKFKNQRENSSRPQSPNSIKEFGIKNKIYLSANVDIEISSDKSQDPNLKLKNKKVFLQVLYKGKKNLYVYKDKWGPNNFYIKQNSELMLLIHKKHLNENSIIENNRFRGQLILYLKDCPSLKPKINNSSYNKKNLINIFKKYYECSNSPLEFQPTKPKIKIEKGIIAGFSLTSLNFEYGKSDLLIYPHLSTNYNSSTDISLGLFLDVIFPKDQGKWSINNEILYSSFETTGYHENYENENVYTIKNSRINLSYLKLNNLLRFNFPSKNLVPYINAGISTGFVIAENNYSSTEEKLYSEITFYESNRSNNKKIEHGGLLGFGVRYDNLSIETRLETTMGLYSGNYKLNRFYFLLNYRL
ncbi:outer membrane beta-barrel protein [Seonamhaeicola sp. MEBiC1930]|uniref:hypothetical protein n=1 Tax=Seonamhaeicola sp. MEBiC01930 TaxID=2976768 RepID=UPI003245BDE7